MKKNPKLNTTIEDIRVWKKNSSKFAALTAYDATFSRMFWKEGIEVMLIGDSLGMTVQGKSSTVSVTTKEIAYHTKMVRRGAPMAWLISDLPFMSFFNLDQACRNASVLIRAGANMVKLEGGSWLCPMVEKLSERSVSVCGHVGLTPQSVNIIGNHRVQGMDPSSYRRILSDAKSLESSGIQILVLECIPNELTYEISRSLSIPTIGIGAGPSTDGQILVMHDIFGIDTGLSVRPRFVRNFLSESGGDFRKAISLFKESVRSGDFPRSDHCFRIGSEKVHDFEGNF
ncbi:3-methyl-2-oxobutanoate hydroxymethyltransferase [Candidatus Riesia pediculicola]|uniref:3-methyl-2-oxobutanoate hydroxymethyltransferase n=1 Tax=Candidatus Riesia pediculicola TaxID=401619 RepID=UPI0009C2A1C7|nr:3-methyl-2-oxobutanoate hydroxymethyltransferase [Candidatus Riesia pediculicola]ARC54023.1 3-methyl-2-oxobutanoate hydroxymethyltransferase [Candidatus Riesia pediculicola]